MFPGRFLHIKKMLYFCSPIKMHSKHKTRELEENSICSILEHMGDDGKK
jgi:hypothetical protein